MTGENWVACEAAGSSSYAPHCANWGEVKIDPYLRWAIATGFEHFRLYQNKKIAFLFELSEEGQQGIADDSFETSVLKELFKAITFGPKPEGVCILRFFTGLITLEQLDAQLSIAAVNRCFTRIEMSLPIYTPGFGTDGCAWQAPSPPTRKKAKKSATVNKSLNSKNAEKHAIVGIIDDDIAFLNKRFQDKTGGTRIHALWNQSGCMDELGGDNVLRKSDIDGYIKHCENDSATYPLMEERVYHDLQLSKLDTSGRWLSVQVVDALNFLLIEANRIAESSNDFPRSLVVNLSFGSLAGPHNGSSMIESAIDHIVSNINAYPFLSQVSVFIAAGNQRQARCTARTTLKKGDKNPTTFRWKVLPDDLTPSFLEIWFPENFDLNHLKGRIKSPRGETLKFKTSGHDDCWVLVDDKNRTIGFVQAVQAANNAAGNRPMLLLAIAPTRAAHKNVAKAVRKTAFTDATTAPGIWEITLACVGKADKVEVEAWIQRDDTLDGNPIAARQSYFDDSNYERTDERGYAMKVDPPDSNSYITRYNTINSIATGRESLSVGAYRYRSSEETRYGGLKKQPKINSSTCSGKGYIPEVLGVGEDSVACPGVLAAGTRSGSSIALGGTSMAAAHATRVAAANVKVVMKSYGMAVAVSGDQARSKNRRLQRPVDGPR